MPTQVAALTAGLLELERDPVAAKPLEALMRAAHSLKGAARIVNLPVVARLAHALEECFVAAQQGKIRMGKSETTVLLRAVDFFAAVTKLSESEIAAIDAGLTTFLGLGPRIEDLGDDPVQ